jgi:hypothetical protein
MTVSVDHAALNFAVALGFGADIGFGRLTTRPIFGNVA